MPQGVSGFSGERLTEARQARGISSSRALADLLGKVTSTVIRWEAGEAAPEYSAVVDMSTRLGLPTEFFFDRRAHPASTIYFRSFAAALKSDRAMQRVRLIWLTDVTAVAEHYAQLPHVDVPDFVGKTGTYRHLRDDDLERLALQLREHWGIGLRPIENAVSTLEAKGVILASEHMETDKLDGLGLWSRAGRPFVLLANDKQSYARRQFDAAHELAHLVLHRHVDPQELEDNLKLIEAQADRFASAFLLPGDQYAVEVQSKDLYELERLKVRWKVSIKAQIVRLQTLGIITDDGATSLFKRYSAKGYVSKGEPYDDGAWKLQMPSLLADVFTAVVDEGGVPKAELLKEFYLSAGDVESLAGLPAGWFASTPARVISLKPVSGPSRQLPQRGEVVSLRRPNGEHTGG